MFDESGFIREEGRTGDKMYLLSRPLANEFAPTDPGFGDIQRLL